MKGAAWPAVTQAVRVRLKHLGVFLNRQCCAVSQ